MEKFKAGGERIGPEYLPRDERTERMVEFWRRKQAEKEEALRKGDTDKANKAAKELQDFLVELGLPNSDPETRNLEDILRKEALRETIKLNLKPDREAPDLEVREASDEETAKMVEEVLESEAERETRGLHRGRPGQN